MLPFCGYNMSDYFQHWINVGQQVAAKTGGQTPRMFCVNWFRKDENGAFVWPGYGDNMRVLKWIIDRIEGKAKGQDTMFGVAPTYAEINWNGISFSAEQFAQVTSIEKAAWAEEFKLHDAHFEQLAYHLPQALRDTRVALENRLAA
jgi:phosphoenolpyruvate carboxykinase (GTP)